MTLPPPLTLTFWFQPLPPPFLPMFEVAILVVFAALVIAGIIVAVIRLRPKTDKLAKELLRRIATVLVVIGLSGLLLYSFTYERISYFSMRVWWAVLFGVFVAWLVPIVRFATKDIPTARKEVAEREKFEKWLPKKKK